MFSHIWRTTICRLEHVYSSTVLHQSAVLSNIWPLSNICRLTLMPIRVAYSLVFKLKHNSHMILPYIFDSVKYWKCNAWKATEKCFICYFGSENEFGKWGRKACKNDASSTVHISSESFVSRLAQRTSALFWDQMNRRVCQIPSPPCISFILYSSFVPSHSADTLVSSLNVSPSGNLFETGWNKLLSFTGTSWYWVRLKLPPYWAL